jgi:hypothetical protein
MLSRRLYRFINYVALFAILFSSLAPTISHAMAIKDKINFAQDICSSSLKKVTIEVVATIAQPNLSVIDVNSSNHTTPISIDHHLEHCPFCANLAMNAVTNSPELPIFNLVAAQPELDFKMQAIGLLFFSVLPPPSQAPPVL